MQNPWRCFEELPGLMAVPALWRAGMGPAFEAFRSLCLRPSAEPAGFYPCPLRRSCGYWLHPQPDGSHLGTCQLTPKVCPQASFAPSDITMLELDWQKLGHALCQAFDVVSNVARFTLPATWQFASWSTEQVPLIATIQYDSNIFRCVIAELGNRLRRPFMLFAPTTVHIDATSQELLANANAGFFPLDGTVRLTDHGTLHSIKTPGDLFAKFAPEIKTTDESVYRQAFALIKQLGPANQKSKIKIRK